MKLELPAEGIVRRYAELFGLQRDLNVVRKYCGLIRGRELWDLLPTSTRTWTFDALGSAVLARYGRCFGDGRGGNLVPESAMKALPEDGYLWHRRFIELRNAHTAHSVEGAEWNRVFVEVDDTSAELRVVRVAPTTGGLACIGTEHAKELDRLCEHALGWVKGELLRLKPEIDNQAFGLDEEALRRLRPLLAPNVPDWEVIDRRIARRDRSASRAKVP